MRIAITGNIGSGKSTYAKMLFEQLGEQYVLVSVDDIVRDLYKDRDFIRQLENEFGTSVRKEVSDIVFADPEARLWLEELTKDKVGFEMYGYDLKKHVVVEFPLLFEMCANGKYDYIITCFCDDTTQMTRVMARDNFTPEKIERIRAAQLSTTVKCAMADHKVDTTKSLADLEIEAKCIARTIQLKDQRLFFQQGFYGHEEAAGTLFDKAMKEYSSGGRYYHNSSHVRSMYGWFMKNVDKFNYPGFVHLAIIYHDVVYNADEMRYTHNEAWSVKFMMDQFAKYLPEALKYEIDGIPSLAAAGELIMATKGHQVKSPYLLANPKLKADCELFLDLDLHILGGTPEEAERFDNLIHQEFTNKFYTDSQFASVRADVLQSFLDRDKVFMSPHFANLETQARTNLQTLINKWKQ